MALESKPLFHPEVIRQQVRAFSLPERVSLATGQPYRATLILAACASLCGVVKAADRAGISAGLLATRQQQLAANPLPDALVPIAPSQMPGAARGLYSLANWLFCPPLPSGCWVNYPSVQATAAMQALTASVGPPRTPGGTGDSGTNDGGGITYRPLDDLSTNFTDLYLQIAYPTNDTVRVTLTNTHEGILYELLTKTDLSNSAWASEKFLQGVTPFVPTNITMGTRTNLFFWARSYEPTNGQVFLTLDSGRTNLSAYVNGKSNVYTAFLSTVVAIPAPVNSLNVGYQGDDYAPELPPENIDHIDQQNVVAVAGFTDTLTNFCASRNLFRSLDVHGLGLADIELYQCTNLTYVSITNCANLTRACLEVCSIGGILDFSGCTALKDIRGALNNYTNIIFNGAGPAVFHLCVRDNPQLRQNPVLTNFYSLKELYMWNCSQTGTLSIVSTNLTDLRVYSNHLTAIKFTNCASLQTLYAQNNNLTTNALDNILMTLTNMNAFGGTLNLSLNPQFPSAAGYAAASFLRTMRGWNVVLDNPGDGTSGDTNSITFVIQSTPNTTTVRMVLQTNGPATVTWHWADGTSDVGPTNITHTFYDLNVTHHINYVTVNPPSAAYWFGKFQNDPPQSIVGVYGVSNFPSLWELYLYNDKVQDLSIANCSSLRELHLACNPVSSNVVDQWCIDLADAVPGNPGTPNAFHFPPIVTSAAAQSATNHLSPVGWNLYPFSDCP